MKKRLVTGLLACALALSFAMPVMGNDLPIVEEVNIESEEISEPRNELTRIYLRTYQGVLQMRVWSITRGIWITDWMPITLV